MFMFMGIVAVPCAAISVVLAALYLMEHWR